MKIELLEIRIDLYLSGYNLEAKLSGLGLRNFVTGGFSKDRDSLASHSHWATMARPGKIAPGKCIGAWGALKAINQVVETMTPLEALLSNLPVLIVG